ncbi:MAG: S8 family serine peptidase, partial [Chloroflexi bacterium]|nr:S8 family serine peptidase [Chloroflexota bacterium]
AAEIIPWPARAIDPIDFQRLLDQAQKKGSVRVIVGLRMNYQPEAQLGLTRAVDLQRQVVDLGQTALINRMAAHNIKGVKRIKNLPFVAMKVDANALAILNALQEVNSINEDAPHFPTLAESTVLIGATTAWANGYSGQGQVVAILDTGVDKTHPFLAGKVVAEGCFSTTDPADYATSVCPGGVQSSTATGSGVPCNAGCDHGTHVAGIAAGKGASFSGVARDAKIIAIQVFTRFDDPNFCGSTAPCVAAYTSDIIQGLQQVYTYASSYTIASANMSLGGGSYTSNCDSADAATKTAIDNLRSIKIATVIASGNESKTNAISSPGCISTAISVGSTRDGSLGTTADTVSSFSNSASFLSLLAPGEYIYSSIPGGGYANYRGTSMAAPHVAGAWAVVKSKVPTASVDQVLNALATTGVSITDSRNGIVKPRIRVDAALNTFSGSAPTVTPTQSSTDVTYDDANAAISYTGAWTFWNEGFGAYNGTFHYSAVSGNTAQLIFSGQSVTLVFTGHPNRGVMRVDIDGVTVANVNEYRASLQWQQSWTSGTLASGTHTLLLTHAR